MSCEIGYVKVDLLKALGMSDSQAIKTAIDFAAATKSFIEFGEGTYTLTEQIRMDEHHAGIRGIKGAGMGKTNIARVLSKNTVTKATSLKAADKLVFRNNQLHLPNDFGRPTARFYVSNPAAQISFTDNDIYTQALINQVRGSWLDNSVSANTIIQRNRVLTINNL